MNALLKRSIWIHHVWLRRSACFDCSLLARRLQEHGKRSLIYEEPILGSLRLGEAPLRESIERDGQKKCDSPYLRLPSKASQPDHSESESDTAVRTLSGILVFAYSGAILLTMSSSLAIY